MECLRIDKFFDRMSVGIKLLKMRLVLNLFGENFVGIFIGMRVLFYR